MDMNLCGLSVDLKLSPESLYGVKCLKIKDGRYALQGFLG